MPTRGRRDISSGVLLLAYEIFSIGYENIPPVTLFTILAQTAIFFGIFPSLDYSHIGDICVLPNRIWRLKEWKRLLFPSFVHGDDMHLYYNMISFLCKGRRLERVLGSVYLAYLLLVFSLLTNVVLVGVSLFLDDIWGFDYSRQCAVGFSGVIFALKVLCNDYFPYSYDSVSNRLPVPSQYACWVELLMIQILVPNASLIGHLSGVLIGLAYVHGPLKWLMDSLFAFVSGISFHNVNDPNNSRPTNDYSDSRNRDNHDRYYDYTGGLSHDEQMRRAMHESYTEYSARTRPSAPLFDQGNRLYPNVY